MNVAILTIEQKDQLVGQQYANDSYFNPIQDVAGNWVISEEEINFCTNDNFSWIKNLELEDYKPINNDL
jgi:hypothetical protein